jgi:hypothetical protein
MSRIKYMLTFGLFVLSLSVMAQKGPGGVGGNEDEKSEDQPLNVLWLRADRVNAADNTPVDEWTDQSGYDFTAVKARASKEGPVFRENMLNGFPWLHFSLDNFLIIPDNDLLDGGDGLSIFVVADYDRSTRGMWDKDQNKTLVCKRRHWNGWSHVPEVTKDDAGLQHAYELRFEYDSTLNPEKDSVFVIAYINGNLPDGSGQDVFTDPAETSDPEKAYLINYNYSGLEGSEGGRIRVNGVSTKHPNRGELNPNPILVGNIINSNADLYIGAAQLDPPGNYGYSESFDDPFPEATEQSLMEGGIAEVIIYRNALNPAQIRIIEHYLTVKYGLDYMDEKVYSNGDFKYDLIGIGTDDGINLQNLSGSGAFSLEAVSESFESPGEYVFAGHNNLPIELSNEGFSEENIYGWNRSWWIEKSGNTDIIVYFDFIESGLIMATISNYRLAYRASADNEYQLIDLVPRKRLRSLYFEVPDGKLNNGEYTLAYIQDNTNVPNNDLSSAIILFPNPSTDKVHLQFQDEITGELEIVLMDCTGRMLNHWTGLKNEFDYFNTLNLGDLSAGTYFFHLRISGNNVIKPIIKKY